MLGVMCFIYHPGLKTAINQKFQKSPESMGHLSGRRGWSSHATYTGESWRISVLRALIKEAGFFGGWGGRFGVLWLGTERERIAES